MEVSESRGVAKTGWKEIENMVRQICGGRYDGGLASGAGWWEMGQGKGVRGGKDVEGS